MRLKVKEMSLIKLHMSVIGTLTLMIALSTLFFVILLNIVGVSSLLSIGILVVLFNIAQWLFAPYIIGALYKVKEVNRSKSPKLYSMVEKLSNRAGIKMPKVMLANINIPNAFAYGSPIGGNRVAVTSGLLKELEEEEVEAVVGHELGHLKHRDVQIMMFASVLPAIFYFMGYSLMMSSFYSGGRREGGAAPALIGMLCMLLYWILSLFVLGLSRIREYYADRESISIVNDGARKLSEALVKIVSSTGKFKMRHKQPASVGSFKSLFIEDPDRSSSDIVQLSKLRRFSSDQQLVHKILSKEVTLMDQIQEVFSTHPNIVKRIKAMQRAS
jgi:heat shock protein HtpX